MTTDEKVHKTLWKPSMVSIHAILLLTLHIFRLLNALFGSNSLCALEGDKLLY